MTSSEESSNSEKTYIQIENQSSGESFLSILEDKNTMIEMLKKQLQNQKMQITYYLHKDLARSKLRELSQTCTAWELDKSLPVELAMSEFRRTNGLKSTVQHLYEHMKYIDEKLVVTLRGQEFILKKIVKRLFHFLKHSNDNIQFKMSTSKVFKTEFCLELFNKLLDATLVLRRKLEAFRICCNRLIVIEDERNVIAEQVSSLPVDQKMNCNFIMNIQMEKARLEKKVKQISQEQESRKEDLKELGILEEKISGLQKQLKSMTIGAGEIAHIDETVRNLDLEAKFLLSVSKRFKDKHRMELEAAKSSNNQILDTVLEYIHLAIEGKDLVNKHLRHRSELELFDNIKKPIAAATGKLTEELDQFKFECESLKRDLNKLLLERNQLKISNYQLQRDFETIKCDHSKELANLQQQRDMYLAQVEDLQTIREAYTHLVGKKVEDKPSNDRRHLVKTNIKLTKQLKIMKDIINRQNEEILLQNDVINHMKSHNESKTAWERNHCMFEYPQVCLINPSSFGLDIDTKEEYEDDLEGEAILVSEEVFRWKSDQNLGRAVHEQCNCQIARAPSIGCFAVYSQNKKVLKQMIKAVVKEQRSDDDTNTSSFTLEINRSCEEDHKMKVKNDKELMGDCSCGSSGAVCEHVQKEGTVPRKQMSKKGSYSRNIQALTGSANKMNSSGKKCFEYT
ncbi:uncharacterized protein [Leptinotarsa decemlineata]|uniref:uncharacterized protein n=1 Tax=Leptinotarsa decemlineata TaxID=7539 RepID=UPI003D305EA2